MGGGGGGGDVVAQPTQDRGSGACSHRTFLFVCSEINSGAF